MSREGYKPVVLVRRVLLVALALFLGVVVTLFVSKRVSQPSALDTERPDALTNVADLALAGKGFDYEVTDGEQRLFHVKAERILTDKQNLVTLEGIVIIVERESGEQYELSADAGTYQAEKKSAVVEGNVRLRGSKGLELTGTKFELLRKGELIKSRSPVAFAIDGEMTGSARELEAYLKKDVYQLNGDVRMQGVANGLAISAQRINYDRETRLIHAEGDVDLRRGGDRLRCRRLTVTMDENSSKPTFVRARWGVQGRLVSNDERGFERSLAIAGEQISLRYDEAGEQPEMVEVLGKTGVPARLIQEDETGWVRDLVTPRIVANFRDGVIHRADSTRPVTLTEYLSFNPEDELTRVCGGDATMKFDRRGELAELELDGGVDLHRGRWQASGDRLEATGTSKVAVVGKPANVYTSRGELSAPSITYKTESGEVIARKGVRAVFPAEGDVALVEQASQEKREPIRLTSETANWSSSEGSFEFKGSVQAWQGESFVTADRLIGGADGNLNGEGNVKTVLEQRPEEGEPVEPTVPVEVTSAEFSYKRKEGLLSYLGSPKVHQAGRFMSCSELDIYLGDDSELDRLFCRGNALIDDQVGGHRVTGSEAVYRPGDSTVEVFGSPVTLVHPNGTTIQGQKVIYDFETAKAQVVSGTSSVPEKVGKETGS